MDISALGKTQDTSFVTNTSGVRIDPYVIYQLNFKALGGEKHVKSASTFSFKGGIELDGHTLDIEEYISTPLKSFKIILSNSTVILKDGNDGWNLWSERNGKVNSVDYSIMPEREIKQLWAEYAYTDPKNTTFTSTAARKVSIDGVSCYEIKIRNKMTDEVVTQYYDAKTFLLNRELRETATVKTQKDFSDYRSIGDIKVAFKVDTTDLLTNNMQSLTWDTVEKDVYIAESLFDVPKDRGASMDNKAILRGIGANLSTYA